MPLSSQVMISATILKANYKWHQQWQSFRRRRLGRIRFISRHPRVAESTKSTRFHQFKLWWIQTWFHLFSRLALFIFPQLTKMLTCFSTKVVIALPFHGHRCKHCAESPTIVELAPSWENCRLFSPIFMNIRWRTATPIQMNTGKHWSKATYKTLVLAWIWMLHLQHRRRCHHLSIHLFCLTFWPYHRPQPLVEGVLRVKQFLFEKNARKGPRPLRPLYALCTSDIWDSVSYLV